PSPGTGARTTRWGGSWRCVRPCAPRSRPAPPPADPTAPPRPLAVRRVGGADDSASATIRLLGRDHRPAPALPPEHGAVPGARAPAQRLRGALPRHDARAAEDPRG